MRWISVASGVWFCVNSLFAVAAPTLFVVNFACYVNFVDTCIEVLVESLRIDLGPSRYGCGGFRWPVGFVFV